MKRDKDKIRYQSIWEYEMYKYHCCKK